jgi:dCMP deaminase
MTLKNLNFINDAEDFANRHSKDRSTKVGAIILGIQNEPLTWGYNGFPRKANDANEARHERPLKYVWTEHAERNAIYNAARTGAKLLGSSMYVTMAPCTDCARAIIQAGVERLYLKAKCFDGTNPRQAAWLESWPVVKSMFQECGVEVWVLDETGNPNLEHSVFHK